MKLAIRLTAATAAVSAVLVMSQPASCQAARWTEDPATFPYRDLSKELANKTTGIFTVTAVGDLLIQEPIGASIDPQIQALLKNSDTTVANMEATLIDRRNWTSGLRGNWSPKETAADIKSLGFDLLTGANNHTWDMGVEGMQSSAKIFDEQGLALAGVGKNLETARMPTFQYTPKGRVAMVGAYAVALNGPGSGPAGSQKGNSGGGWGYNPLRLTTWNVVTADQMTSLKGIRDSIVARRNEPDVVRPIRMPKDEPDKVTIFADNYMVGPKPGEYVYEMNKADRLGNVTAVRNAKEYSDYVVFTMHVHQNRHAFQAYSQDNYPPSYEIDFAHELVDNGADLYLGTGNHTMQGVEIYKGRPIFYNLGNFSIHEVLIESPDAKPGETALEADEVDTDYFQHPENLVALLATTKYVSGKLVEVKLYPVDLGAGKNRPWSQMSIARTPSPELAQKILTDVQRYSQPFGTKIDIVGGVGVIKVDPAATVDLAPVVKRGH